MNKAELPCFACGELGHFSMECLERVGRQGKKANNGHVPKAVNIVIASNGGDTLYDILATVLSVF